MTQQTYLQFEEITPDPWVAEPYYFVFSGMNSYTNLQNYPFTRTTTTQLTYLTGTVFSSTLALPNIVVYPNYVPKAVEYQYQLVNYTLTEIVTLNCTCYFTNDSS